MKPYTFLAILAAVVVAGCKPGTQPSSGVVVAQQAIILKNRMFMPRDVTVSAGSVITFTNEDAPTVHTVSRDITTKPGPDKVPLTPGDSYVFVIPTGTPSGANIFYHCMIHGAAGNGTTFGPGMSGVLRVK